ncbi:Uncharacterised protein [Mycobacteroides abscessus subsp. abscessus]|nr:Uncharacterised protein [Mycobacteroides abscessus subsp. abscessus]
MPEMGAIRLVMARPRAVTIATMGVCGRPFSPVAEPPMPNWLVCQMIGTSL